MESLELIKGLEAIQDTSGPDLYYGVYRNRLCVPFRSIGRVRYDCTPEKFQSKLSYIHPSTWNRPGSRRNEITVAEYIANDGGNTDDLLNFLKWRVIASGVKVVLNLHKVTLYFNNIDAVKKLIDVFPEKIGKSSLHYRVKIPNFERGVVYQKNPQHKWRIYLRAGLAEDIQELSTTINQYGFYPCPTIKRTTAKNNKFKYWIFENNFLDCDDEGLITVFALKFPNIVKKVCRIELR